MPTTMFTLIDTHCHIATQEFATDREAVIQRAREAGVTRMIVIGPGSGLEGNHTAIQLAEQHDGLYASVGIHPHEAHTYTDDQYATLLAWSRHPKVVAIGECGLDYFYPEPPKPDQHNAFEAMIALSIESGKPLTIHCRDAYDDTFSMLEARKAELTGGIMHCFSGNIDQAKRTIDLGFYLSIPGVVTFKKKSEQISEVVKWAPLDHLLIETDAPYLAPVPHRGKRNEPAFVVEVAKKIAEIKGLSFEDVARATSENANRLFGIS